jgi:hypothetical protein
MEGQRTDRRINRQVEGKIDRWKERQTGGRKDRQGKERQTDGRAVIQIDVQTVTWTGK